MELEANVHAQAASGATALHCAAKKGQVEALTVLVELGVDVHTQSVSGAKALHWAAIAGQVEVVRVLVELEADVHAQAASGHTARHLAASAGQVEAVRVLVEAVRVQLGRSCTPKLQVEPQRCTVLPKRGGWRRSRCWWSWGWTSAVSTTVARRLCDWPPIMVIAPSSVSLQSTSPTSPRHPASRPRSAPHKTPVAPRLRRTSSRLLRLVQVAAARRERARTAARLRLRRQRGCSGVGAASAYGTATARARDGTGRQITGSSAVAGGCRGKESVRWSKHSTVAPGGSLSSFSSRHTPRHAQRSAARGWLRRHKVLGASLLCKQLCDRARRRRRRGSEVLYNTTRKL